MPRQYSLCFELRLKLDRFALSYLSDGPNENIQHVVEAVRIDNVRLRMTDARVLLVALWSS
jgi:hypothetical protein